MTKAFFSGGIKAVMCGLAGSTGFALVCGTAALPFVISASIGFAIGTIGFYRDALSKAVLAVERYPLLLRLHLTTNFPHKRFDLWENHQFRAEELRKSCILSNMLVASWMSASPAIDISITQSYVYTRCSILVAVLAYLETAHQRNGRGRHSIS